MSKTPAPKTPRQMVIGVRVEPDLWKAIAAEAEKEQRSLSQWVAMRIRELLGMKK